MTKNGIVLVAILVILGSVYAFFFTDLFNRDYIQIIPQVRPGRASAIPRTPGEAPVYPVSFLLHGKYRLTSIKVVSADDLSTNKYPVPLWHMISDSNSIPLKNFQYGERIRGMKPAVPHARPEPLEPGIKYVLMLESGRVKGQTNFFTREVVQPGR